MAYTGDVFQSNGKYASVDVKIDLSKLENVSNYIDDAFYIFMYNEIKKYCNDYVPFRSGTLSQTVEITKDYLRYYAPYAHYQYVGFDFDFLKEQHPLAGPEWDKRAMAVYLPNLEQSVKNYLLEAIHRGNS